MVLVIAAAMVAVEMEAAEFNRIADQTKGPYRMFKNTLNILIAGALLFMESVQAKEPIRIDATSDAAADMSYARMVESLPARKRQQLVIAMLILNMDGVSSAHEVVSDPELQHPSIERIKERVSGMTADEVIRLSKGVTTVRAEIRRP